MLESLFSELNDLLWGLGIVSFAIVGLLILPKKTLKSTWSVSFDFNDHVFNTLCSDKSFS